MIRIRNRRDFLGGLMLLALGVAAIAMSSGYAIGTAARMGPGYFPRALGMLLIAIGGVIAAQALRVAGPRFPRWPWRPTIVVLGSVVLFGAIVERSGLALSTVVLVFLASAASAEFRPREALVSAVVLAVLAVLVFAVGLQVQLPTWPVWTR
jgi:heme A synthase